MTRRLAIGLLLTPALALLLEPGCGPAAAPAPAPSGSLYGEHQMPPAGKAAPKSGMAPQSPGAPPLAR